MIASTTSSAVDLSAERSTVTVVSFRASSAAPRTVRLIFCSLRTICGVQIHVLRSGLYASAQTSWSHDECRPSQQGVETAGAGQIGRASCRERVKVWVVVE